MTGKEPLKNVHVESNVAKQEGGGDTGAEGAHASWSCHARSSSSPSRILRCWSLFLSGEEPVGHLKPLPRLLVTSVLAEDQDHQPDRVNPRWTLVTAAPGSFWRSHGISTTHSIYLNIWFFHRPLASYVRTVLKMCGPQVYIIIMKHKSCTCWSGTDKIWAHRCNLVVHLRVLLMPECKFGRLRHRTHPLRIGLQHWCPHIHPICLLHDNIPCVWAI